MYDSRHRCIRGGNERDPEDLAEIARQLLEAPDLHARVGIGGHLEESGAVDDLDLPAAYRTVVMTVHAVRHL